MRFIINKRLIKISAWFLAFLITIIIFIIYLTVSGFDGGYNIQLKQGDEAFAAKNYKSAVAHYKRAVENSPKNSTPRIKEANALVSLDEKDEAIKELEEYIEADPRTPEVYNLLYSLYKETNAPPEKSISLLKKAADLFGDATYAEMAGSIEKGQTEVEAPKVDIPGGNYDETQTIKVTNIENDESVYYTTDGKTDPTSISKKYKESSGITIQKGTTTLRLIKINQSGTESSVAEEVYNIVG